MSNKNAIIVIFDYRLTQGRQTRSSARKNQVAEGPLELKPWLDLPETKKFLYNKRLFYIVKPNVEGVCKFGIAGNEGGKASGWGRLHQYVHSYGEQSDLSACAGVKLLYLAGNEYNPNVENIKSAVYRKELAAKRFFRDDALKGRGFERILQERLDELFKILEDPSNKSFEDIETERRRTERLTQANVNADDAVLAILKHDTKGGKSKARTQYLTKWSRPYVLTEKKRVKGEIVETTKEVDTTWETYTKLIGYLDGLAKLKIYKEQHPSASFRD